MVIAAISLFFGAMPIAYKIIGLQAVSLVALAWLVSGVAAVYLGYLWHKGGQKVFGGDDKQIKILFIIMVVTGLNLGYVAIGNINLGMSFLYGMPIAGIIFKATAVGYLYVAYTLWTKWKENGEALFTSKGTEVKEVSEGASEESIA
jgi:hypothetical protein